MVKKLDKRYVAQGRSQNVRQGKYGKEEEIMKRPQIISNTHFFSQKGC